MIVNHDDEWKPRSSETTSKPARIGLDRQHALHLGEIDVEGAPVATADLEHASVKPRE